jgi:beta-galactosidase
MAENKKEFQFITEIPKNTYGEKFEDLFIYPLYDEGKVAIQLTTPADCEKISWQILDKDRIIAANSAPAPAPGSLFQATETVPDFRPWNVNTPYLYTCRITLTHQNDEQSCAIRFGMRKYSISRDSFFLNNENLYLRGVIRGREAHDHPDLLNLGWYEYYAKYMRQMKRYGFNFIRFHSFVPPMECFQAADELGILIHIELRKYYGKYQKERSRMDSQGSLLNREEWAEMVRRLRNSTSLMVYCMGNEIDHPGRNPICQEFYEMTHRMDPTRFFLDTCSRGEFDRTSVDLDVQHMSYFFPWGHAYDMFDNPQNWLISGSASGIPMIVKEKEDDPDWTIARKVPSRRPVIAHEICHYSGLHDLETLGRKFDQHCPQDRPWWIDELKKLVALKGFTNQYDIMIKASHRFRELAWKLNLEAARRSKLLCGFHFLQFCDTNRYENSNGIVDCFDDSKGVSEQEFQKFNGDTVLLADLPRRVFFQGDTVTAPAVVSHFSAELAGTMTFEFKLVNSDGTPVRQGTLSDINLNEKGRHDLCVVTFKLPVTSKPEAYRLIFSLLDANHKAVVENDWNLWSFPNQPQALPEYQVDIRLENIFPLIRYPQLRQQEGAKLRLQNRFTKDLLEHVGNGGDAWVMYRVPVTRDRKVRAPKEKYYLPAVWDRFKAIIWDRGHNSGAFIRDNAALDGFPNDGFVNLQFANLINDCDKVILDDFPVQVEPIMEGVDRAVRDRFDVYNFKLSELQPAYTMRKFAYLFELRVGKGRLFVSAFNFTGLNQADPETVGMFESIMRYLNSSSFAPKAAIETEALAEYLLRKGEGPIIKERRMTQYWQLDEEPLESLKYWNEALAYIDEEVKETDIWMKAQANKLSLEDKSKK